MKIADLKALPEGTQLRAGRDGTVTLTGIRQSRGVVRTADGETREYGAASLHQVVDLHPLVKGLRAGLTGHTITIERADRTTARAWMGIVEDWQALIGRRALVERHEGRLAKVCAVEGAEHCDGVEEIAAPVARTHGARYIPVGS